MSILGGARARVRALLFRNAANRELSDEIEFHLELEIEKNLRLGCAPDEARRLAMAHFGGVQRVREEHRDVRRLRWIEDAIGDMRFAIRSLRHTPGLAITCIVTIALGVGANGAMFSFADRLFTRPPSGVSDPGALRRLYARTTWNIGEVPSIEAGFPYRVFALLDSSLAPRVQLAGYTPPDTMQMISGTVRMQVHGSYVTAGYMPVLGVRPATGRFFTADEEIPGTPVHVAVISDRFWRRALDADSNVIGKLVTINRQRTTIVGVAPRGFDGPDLDATEVWMPLPAIPAPSDGMWYKSFFVGGSLRLLGRVTPGTSDQWISNAATTIVRRTSVPEGGGQTVNAMRDSGVVMLAGPILESLAPSIKPAPQVAIATRLIGVTIIVLLIACANVASLLLARGMARRREIAVRVALGASRRRLVAQLLCEGVILAVAAGAAALFMSWWGGTALRGLLMPGTNWSTSPVDARVLSFIGLTALATGLLAGLVPALQTSKPDLTEALKSGAREGHSGVRRSRLRQLLLVAQIAMSVLLLYGSGLFVHSLMRLRQIDMGFDADRVVYGSVNLLSPDGAYVDRSVGTWPRIERGLTEAAERLRGAPGVEEVALSTGGPMGAGAMIGLYMADGSHVPLLDKRDAIWNAATPNYLRATGSRLARGRFFTQSETRGANVMVVNEIAARTYWPQRDAIGQCLHLFSMKEPCTTVVGVLRDSHVDDVVEKPVLQLVTPIWYDSTGLPAGADNLIVRAQEGHTAAVEALVRREITRAFPTLAVPYVQSVQDTMAEQLRPWRVGLLLFGGFGILALIIAALGTYSVLSYAVTQRLHEIGVRIALGARADAVVRLVVGQGLRLALLGVVLGSVIALAASRVMQALLYDTSPREPTVTIAVGAMLLLIAAVASAVPARRASRVDPVTVLRAD